ncbi:lymphocyte antigen 6H isoform X2 [Manis pentadactyla]|uniref:lymphocyte antigen 6H isoform X2 n=1 Tax=Manis pentadactyla TaxID=143292 RepID=UPI00255C6968|nr:lymphocyte antigen 6H isoform X2 [Manis pentadactyla]
MMVHLMRESETLFSFCCPGPRAALGHQWVLHKDLLDKGRTKRNALRGSCSLRAQQSRIPGTGDGRETEGHRCPRRPELRSADARDVSAPPTQARAPRPDPRPAPQRTPAHSPRAFPRPAWSMLPAAMKGLCLLLLAALLYSAPVHGLWCQDCTLTTNSSHCTPRRCQPSDTVCASVRITDPSSSRKDHSVNKMCASSCDFVKRHFFSDYLMGFINSGILKVDVDCCEKDLCNRVLGPGGSPWVLAGGLLLSLGPALLWAGP